MLRIGSVERGRVELLWVVVSWTEQMLLMRRARTAPAEYASDTQGRRTLRFAFERGGAAALLLLVATITGIGLLPLTSSPLAPVRADQPDSVQALFGQGKPTIAEFGSTRCKACREMKVVLDELQRSHGDRIAIADVDLFSPQGRGMISRYRVQMMPTQIFFDPQGTEIGRHFGAISAPEILKRLGGVPAPVPSGAVSP